jgi:hypothetical protein
MNCNEFRNLLELMVEERGTLSPDAVRHAEECTEASCRSHWQDFQLLESAIADWKRQTAAVDLVDGVLERHSSTNPSVSASDRKLRTGQRETRRDHLAAIMSTAAILTAAICVAVGLSLHEPSSGQLATNGKPMGLPRVPDTPHVRDPETQSGLVEIGSVYANWMEGATTHVTDSVAVVLLDDEHPKPNGEVSSEWFKVWGERLKPIEQKVDEAIRQWIDEPQRDQTLHHDGSRGSHV